jgi:pimeloyl-ACP methyl ester carboxylesterase
MSGKTMAMRTVIVDGVELAYDDRGSGEPIVLIHGSAVKDDLLPVADHLVRDGFRVVRYHRRGYGSGAASYGAISIQDQSRDCIGLLRELGIEHAHIAGHSTGGVIALQVALDAPRLLRSLILLEPALILIVPSGQAMMQQMTPVVEMFQRGDKQQAVETFVQAISRPNARQIFEDAIPGSYDECLTMGDMFFGVEMPSLQEWTFSPQDGQRIKQPVLFVLGDETLPPFREVHTLLGKAFPHMETATIAGGTHIFDIEKPAATAEAIGKFVRATTVARI